MRQLAFSRCPADDRQGRRASPFGAARDPRHHERHWRIAGAAPLIALIAASLAAAAPAAHAAPTSSPPMRLICRAIRGPGRERSGRCRPGLRTGRLGTRATRIRRRRGCGPRRAICGSRPANMARPRSTSTVRSRLPGLVAEQLGEALLDRARAAEALNDLKTARAKLSARCREHRRGPLLLVFLGRAGDPRRRSRRPPSRRSTGRLSLPRAIPWSCSKPAMSGTFPGTRPRRAIIGPAPQRPTPPARSASRPVRRLHCWRRRPSAPPKP